MKITPLSSRLAFLLGWSALAPAGFAQTEQSAEPVITVEGQSFDTWQEYTSSHLFRILDKRCGTPTDPGVLGLDAPGDCSLSNTTIKPEFDPTFVYEIPVVVHVLYAKSGAGNVSDALIQSQIDVLNEDFLALAGSNGAGGTDAQIQFRCDETEKAGHALPGRFVISAPRIQRRVGKHDLNLVRA